MKTKQIFSKSLIILSLFTGLTFAACESDDVNDNTYAVSGNGSGAQENPPVATSGTSTLTGSYNADINRLDYTINWNGLSGPATMAHFHGPALTGVNAGAMVTLSITTNGINGTASGSAILHDTAENHLLNGRVYYNIHTATHINGEVRGQVITTSNN